MIDVIRVPLPKDKLQAMSKEERSLLLLLGHAANQITILSKMLIFSTNKTPEHEPEQQISGAQSQMLARYAIAIMDEAWKFVSRDFLGTPLGKEYIPKLNPAGAAAFEALKKSFASNLFSKIRNEHVFHLPKADVMDKAFQAAADNPAWDNDWNWWFSPYTMNTFYFMSDVVFLHGLLQAVGETDLMAGYHKVMAEVQTVSQQMTAFIYALTSALLAKYFAPELIAQVHSKIDNAPSIMDIWIPFFVEIPDEDTAQPDIP